MKVAPVGENEVGGLALVCVFRIGQASGKPAAAAINSKDAGFVVPGRKPSWAAGSKWSVGVGIPQFFPSLTRRLADRRQDGRPAYELPLAISQAYHRCPCSYNKDMGQRQLRAFCLSPQTTYNWPPRQCGCSGNFHELTSDHTEHFRHSPEQAAASWRGPVSNLRLPEACSSCRQLRGRCPGVSTRAGG